MGTPLCDLQTRKPVDINTAYPGLKLIRDEPRVYEVHPRTSLRPHMSTHAHTYLHKHTCTQSHVRTHVYTYTSAHTYVQSHRGTRPQIIQIHTPPHPTPPSCVCTPRTHLCNHTHTHVHACLHVAWTDPKFFVQSGVRGHNGHGHPVSQTVTGRQSCYFPPTHTYART